MPLLAHIFYHHRVTGHSLHTLIAQSHCKIDIGQSAKDCVCVWVCAGGWGIGFTILAHLTQHGMQGTCKVAVFTHWRTCEWTLLIMSLLFKPECVVQGFHSWSAAETCLFKSSTFPTQCVRYSKKGNRNDEYNCWIFLCGSNNTQVRF